MERRPMNHRAAAALGVEPRRSPWPLAACGGGDGGGTVGGRSRACACSTTTPTSPTRPSTPTSSTPAARPTASRSSARRCPGDTLIQKVLQQSSSKTLPDVLMLDNPDLQQIAATGALAPLDEFGLSADGYAKGVVDASTYEGKLYGLQPITNTIGAVLQQGHPGQGGRHAAEDVGRAARPPRRS